MEKSRTCAKASKSELNSRGVEPGENRNHPRKTNRGGEGESLPKVNNLSAESTSKNDIGRELDRVIEELFEVESKQRGGRRKGEKLMLSLWREDEKPSTSSEEQEDEKPTTFSEEDELEDIEALLGNDGKDSSETDEDEDDNVPFYGFPTLDDARQTRLVALIKTFESEEAFDEIINNFEALEDDCDNQEEEEGADELGCKEEEWKLELCLTSAWRKTQKA